MAAETSGTDVNSGVATSLSDANAAWLASFDQTVGADTPIDSAETQAAEEVEDSGDSSSEDEDQAPPAEVAKGKSQTIPYHRFQSVTEQKNQALAQAQAEAQARVAAETRAQMLEAQMAQVMAFINSQGNRMQPSVVEEEPEFVDPYEQKLREQEAKIAKFESYLHEQDVQRAASSYEQEWNQSTAMYPLAAQAQPLVFALLETNKNLSIKDAVIQVHNHLASVLPKSVAQPKSKPAPAAPAKTVPASAKGPGRVGGGAVTAAPQYKTMKEAMAAYLASES